jgi:hypothetical protein
MKGIAQVASLMAVLALAGTAAAGNHGGASSNNSGGSNKSSGSSISLVMLAAGTAGTSGPRWGDQVTFNVSTTQTAYPSVQTDCTQNGTLVYRQFGFFYSRPDSPVFTLSSTAWTGGAADCVASLYYVNAKGQSVTIASTSFSVSA